MATGEDAGIGPGKGASGPALPAPVIDQHVYAAELDRIAELVDGPALHVGARSQVLDRSVEDRRTWRERLGAVGYVGADLEPGPNVDAVFDVTWPMERIAAALAPREAVFGTVLALHLLEHVRDPFAAARNLAALVAPGGHLFVQVPWVQAFHPFPDDYWRISLSGLLVLFEGLEPVDAFYSGGSSDVAFRITRGGRPAFDREVRHAEASLFQVVLEREANVRFLRGAGKRAALSRAYLPLTVVNFLARRSR
jgi:SAM-dependent methyltransferase